MPVVALDLDGVMWTGREPIAGSSEAVARLREADVETVFVTNNSFATEGEQEAKLASFGVDATGRVLSSAMAAAQSCSSGERAIVLGGPGIEEALGRRDVEVIPDYRDGDAVPDVVVVGLDWDLTYHRLRAAVQAVRAGARFLATNLDSVYPTEFGFYPGAGSLVAAVEAGAARPPLVAGKPEQPLADLVVERFGADGWMIGDRPDTDGRFAQRCGYRFGLVLSGVTARSDLPVSPAPDMVAEDLARLLDALGVD